MKETKFKQTDIGLIPEDWVVKCVKNVAENFTGLTYSPDDVKKYGTIVLRSSNIQNGKLCFENNVFVDMDIPNRARTKNGDILICVRNGSSELIGKSALIPIEYENVAFGAFMTVLRSVHINNIFLLYIWQNSKTQKQVHETFGATINQITDKDFLRILIPIPPTIDEQKRIANALSQVDDLLAALDEQIEKEKLIKQGTMQQLLTGKTRLQGFCHPWVEKEIEKLGNLTGAGVDKKKNEDEKPVRLVNYLDVFRRDVIFDRELDFWVTANETKLQQCNVLQGDVFFTPSSEMPYDIALSAVAMENMDNVCYSYHIYRLRFFENIDLKYKAYMFKSPSFYDQANVMCEGSGKRYVISLSKFRKMKVFYPSDIEEQQAIANILSTMDEEIQALQEERDKYALVKQGMMQQLLTGKIRLN